MVCIFIFHCVTVQAENSRERHSFFGSLVNIVETTLITRRRPISHAASFPIKHTIDQPRFQSNIPLNRWYISSIFQIWSAPDGYI